MSELSSLLEQLGRLAYERLGLNLTRGAVAAALERYIECYGGEVSDVDVGTAAFENFVAAVTVQHSWLFRDPQQLELACRLLAADVPRSSHSVWIPACATGEDVYSLLALAEGHGLGVSALGTDVHAPAIESARRALYGEASTRHVPVTQRRVLEPQGDRSLVVERLRRRAQFRLHNLLDPAPASSRADGKWDLILCRNVLIYFSPEHVVRAVELLRDALAPGGTLILGASDILTHLPSGLEAREHGGRIVFKRVEPARRPIAPVSRAWVPVPRVEPTRPQEHARPLASDPDEDAAIEHLVRGLELWLEFEVTPALAAFRAALFLSPDLWPASYYLGVCLDALGQPEEARRAYRQTCDELERGRPTPEVPDHDFSFVRRDMALLAERRARR